MKKITISIILSVFLIFGITLNAAPYQDYVDNGTQYTAVAGDTWISSGTYDYIVPKGYKPYNVLTNDAGTQIGTYFITSGVGAGTFKEDGSGYTFNLNGMNSVSYWSGSDWVSFSGSSLTLRKSGANWGWYQYGGAVLVSNISGASPAIGLRRTVTDLQPAISGKSTYISNVDNPLTESYIRSTITVIDDLDGDISHLIELVADNYTANKTVLGTYTIDYRVEDSAGNEATFQAKIKVADATKPIITGPTSMNVSYTALYDLNNFIATKLSVTDNYDTSLTIGIESNGYASKYNAIGSYEVVFNAIDDSTNKGLHTTTFNVIDDVAPVWSGATTIVKNATEILTINDIKAQVTATDYIDGVLTVSVKTDGFSGSAHKVGSYQIVFQATDLSGNTSTKTVTVQVKDNIPPVFFVDNYWINVGADTVLSQQQIIDLLIETGQITVTASTQVLFMTNQYEGNETVPGVYAMSLMTRSSSGVEMEKSFAITVLETEDDGGIIIEEKEDNLFEMTLEWVKENKMTTGLILVGALVLIGGMVILSGSNKLSHSRNKYDKYRR